MKSLYAVITIVILVIMLAMLFESDKNMSYNEYIASAEKSIKKGDIDKGIIFYNKALKLKNDDKFLHLALGKAYGDMFKKSYDLAYEKYTKALKYGANSGLNIDEELKKYGLECKYMDKAISEYKEVVKLDPLNVEARNYLAVYYLNNHKFDAAIRELNFILKQNSKLSGTYWNLADAYLGIDNYSMAIISIEKGYHVENDYEYYRYKLGEVYFKMKNYEKAYEILNELQNIKSVYYNKLLDYKISCGL